MRYFVTLLAALTMCTTVQADEAVDLKCSQATNVAVATFNARKDGLTESQAMGMLREQKIYSGILVWAVKQGLRAPADAAEWVVRGSVFGECVKRGAV
ncbi:hypothetical protein [Microvirga sp. 17 mud 1-3]|uniref:hypothetical protein n=1 Tax=Microvirga sp. 17 mud 1-3 TaxID=2082949 RepID=UPI000D6AF353|nr:hypothetical protein [Microvirga sp. 17 mud 1-3]AWM87349.1 hypothetical protein C4E04_11795 [Microvirga sp. 17 mud 1-3]